MARCDPKSGGVWVEVGLSASQCLEMACGWPVMTGGDRSRPLAGAPIRQYARTVPNRPARHRRRLGSRVRTDRLDHRPARRPRHPGTRPVDVLGLRALWRQLPSRPPAQPRAARAQGNRPGIADDPVPNQEDEVLKSLNTSTANPLERLANSESAVHKASQPASRAVARCNASAVLMLALALTRAALS